jgi:hypothetical protein
MSIVAATVVAPGARVAITNARSRREHFCALWPSLPSVSSSAAVRPTRIMPSRMAIVAGVAPLSRTTCSTSRAVATLAGYGIPCEMMVDLPKIDGGNEQNERKGTRVRCLQDDDN